MTIPPIKQPVVTTPANCLRGKWVPKLTFGAGSTGLTYASQTGIYTKVCGVVICNFNIVLSAKGTSTGNAELTGLPFPTLGDDATYGAGSLSFWRNMSTPLVTFSICVYAGSVTGGFLGATAAAGTLGAVTDAAFGDASQIAGTIVYHVA